MKEILAFSFSKVSKYVTQERSGVYGEEVLKLRMIMRVKANIALGKQLQEDEKRHVPVLLKGCFTYASF